MTQPLTVLERQVYDYLVDFLTAHTYQPSIREIGREFGIKSTKTVSDLLHSLAGKGFIERDPARSRGVRILGLAAATRLRAVPVYGEIHAGEPSLLPEHRTDYLTLERRFVPNETSFSLRVEGDSMTGRGILDGDYVIVDPGMLPDEGAIIAARIGGSATVKTFTRDGDTIVLQPANPDDDAITVGPETDFSLLGTVTGVFRGLYEPAPLNAPNAAAADAAARAALGGRAESLVA